MRLEQYNQLAGELAQKPVGYFNRSAGYPSGPSSHESVSILEDGSRVFRRRSRANTFMVGEETSGRRFRLEPDGSLELQDEDGRLVKRFQREGDQVVVTTPN